MWQLENEKVKTTWKTKAEQIKAEHHQKYPNYTYRPRKASEKKRRMTKRKLALLSEMNEQIANVDFQDPPAVFNTAPISESKVMDFLPMKPDNPMARQFDVPTSAADILQLDQDIHMYNTSQGLVEPDGPLISATSFTEGVYQDHLNDMAEFYGMLPFDMNCEVFDRNDSAVDTNNVSTTISANLIQPAIPTTFPQIIARNEADQPRMAAENGRQRILETLALNNWYDAGLE